MIAMLRSSGSGVDDSDPDEKARRGAEPEACGAERAANSDDAARGAGATPRTRNADEAEAAATEESARAGATHATAEAAAATGRTADTLRNTRSIAGEGGQEVEGRTVWRSSRWRQARREQQHPASYNAVQPSQMGCTRFITALRCFAARFRVCLVLYAGTTPRNKRAGPALVPASGHCPPALGTFESRFSPLPPVFPAGEQWGRTGLTTHTPHRAASRGAAWKASPSSLLPLLGKPRQASCRIAEPFDTVHLKPVCAQR